MIPEGISQVPSEAFALAESKIKELTEKHKTNTKKIAKITKKIRRDILAIHEEAQIAKDVLETVRKPGGTKHFAVIQGFIPSKMEEKFKDSTKQWMSVVEDITDPKLKERIPTLFDNKKFVRTFEVITESQRYSKTWRSRPNSNDCSNVANFLWTNVCRYGPRSITNGDGIIIQSKRTRCTFKMGNVDCNIWCFSCNSRCWCR